MIVDNNDRPIGEKLVDVAEAFGRAMTNIDKPSYLYWYVATEMVGRLGFLDCVVYAVDRMGGMLQQQAAFGEKTDGLGVLRNYMEIPIGHGISGHVAMTGAPIIVQDAANDPRYIVDLSPMRSEITVPIMVGGTVHGVIDCESPEPDAFDDTHLYALRTVASLIAPKLESLNEQAARAMGKQELIAENLRLSIELERAQNQARSVGHVQASSTLIRLSGGIAHDFNNQLAIMRAALYADEATPPNVEMANEAIDRAAELTNRLLAFSSQQALAPHSINFSGVIEEMRGVLQDMLGDRSPLSISIPDDLWDVNIDLGRLEQTLVSLVFNASDAMPDGGPIQISCSNVELEPGDVGGDLDLAPGQYVVLAVTDHGVGMSSEVKAQAFTPYFTTKDDEERVGLGLSMAYGFARQSGGDARISSVLGEGTSVTLYFPREVQKNVEERTPQSAGPRRGDGETILVIDDNSQLTGAVVNVLELLDYRPILAETAQEGLQRAAASEHIDLILIDAILDKSQTGPEVYDELVGIIGEVPVLFMSGHADVARTRLGGRIGDRPFMAKPFTMEELANRIHEILHPDLAATIE